jgi:hypothetical protein
VGSGECHPSTEVAVTHQPDSHEGGWQVRCLDGGAVEWTSPTGREYVKPPEPDDEPPSPQATAVGRSTVDHVFLRYVRLPSRNRTYQGKR